RYHDDRALGMGNDGSSGPSVRASGVTRALSFVLTVGLGASLASVVPRLWAGPATPPGTIAPAPPAPKIEIHDIAIASGPVSPKDGVTAVVMAGRHAIETCAQRWLPPDTAALGEVRLTVRLNVGISGRVKHFYRPGRARDYLVLDPCIKEAVSHWQLPQ